MSRGLNKPLRINLANARTGQGEVFDISGRYIRVVSASSAGAIAQVSLRGDFNTTDFDLVEQAFLFEGQGFDGIHITNEAQPGEWIKIVISDGPDDFDYERPTNNNIGEILEPVKIAGGENSSFGAVTIGTAAALLVQGDADNAGWMIQNLGSADIFIGPDASVTVANGIKVSGNGGMLSWDFRGDIYAISGSAGNDIRYFRSIV